MANQEHTNNSPKGPVTVLGDAYVGETLIARPNGVGDADGINQDTVRYQWLRDGEIIADATSRYYVVSDSDIGARLSVRYSYTDFGGTEEVLTSDPEPAVPAPGTVIDKDDGPYNALIVLGDAEVGQQLTARPNAVFDANGIDPNSKSFQWLRDGEPISGATNQIYKITEADIGAQISVEYTYDDLLGTTKSLTSNPKSAVPVPEPVAPEPVIVDDTAIDLLTGTSDADTLKAAVGLKRISGLDDTDTVFFPGDQSQYSLVFGPDGVSVTDHRLFGLGTIKLDSVELIDFDVEIDALNGPLDLEHFGGLATLDQASLESIVELYIAYFNRAPDALGLNFWGSAFAEGTSLEEMAFLFSDQVETRAEYPSDMSDEIFAQTVYTNVLGRAPDQDGLKFWVDALGSGEVTRDQFILQVLDGAKSEFKMERGYEFVRQQLTDREYLENKVDIGAHFAVHRGMSDVENATAVMERFDGSQSSINAAVAMIEDHYIDALNPYDGEFLIQVLGVLDSPFIA